jgi:2-hydroxy-6-oxonona-2,4-dienedioate hydrolase
MQDLPEADSARRLPELIAGLASAARIERTPCGEGTMTWRCWGTGRPLVLLHGGGGSWEHWARNIGPLARIRQVWCPDLPTAGDSADPCPAPVGVEDIAEAVAVGLDRLLPGPRAFDLAGFSFGGLIATCVAHRRPGRVARLVLVGVTALGLPRPDMAFRLWKREADPAQRLAAHAHNLRVLMVASRESDPDAEALHARNVERARFNGREAASGTLIRDRVGGLDVERVDAIYGELDATAPGRVDAARAVLQAQRPGLRFAAIPGAGHWVQYERAAAFQDALLGMLGEAGLSPSAPTAGS